MVTSAHSGEEHSDPEAAAAYTSPGNVDFTVFQRSCAWSLFEATTVLPTPPLKMAPLSLSGEIRALEMMILLLGGEAHMLPAKWLPLSPLNLVEWSERGNCWSLWLGVGFSYWPAGHHLG